LTKAAGLTDDAIEEAAERVRAALGSVPTTAYSVPHVYPSAAPRYRVEPLAVRAIPPTDHLRLYVHVPFCRYHCTFCHFAVRAGATPSQMERYVLALERELALVPKGTPLSQLFIGGGTPTALPPELLDRLLAAIIDRTPDAGMHVHTVETSPETLTEAHLDVLRRRGVGRVSMGVQTLDDAVLARVRRTHTKSQTMLACERLAGSGLVANVDLLYGLPGQTPEAFRSDLRTLADAGIHSFTLYSLRVNERTPVTKALGGPPFTLETLIGWRAFVKRVAEDLGYTQTRWHTFKRLDTAARTHVRAPCFDDRMVGYQMGIGLSARSHLGWTIFRNHEGLDVYLRRVEHDLSPVEQTFVLDAADRRTQFIARTLGDGSSLPRSAYAATFGREFDEEYGAPLASLRDGGLVCDHGDRIALTHLGGLVYDLVTLAFYPPRAQAWLRARERHAFVQLRRASPRVPVAS